MGVSAHREVRVLLAFVFNPDGVGGGVLSRVWRRSGCRSSAVAIAITAMLVCGFHYFGIFAFTLIVVGDAVASREPWRLRARRLTPAAAGPLTWMVMLPIFRAQIAGYEQRTFLWPLTGDFARAVIFGMFRVPGLIILALLGAWLISGLLTARSRKSSGDFSRRGPNSICNPRWE